MFFMSLTCYCGPVFVMILSLILFKTRLTWPKTVGFFIVVGGMLLINGHLLQAGYSGWGLFCGMMSAVMYAVLVICNKKAAAIAGLEASYKNSQLPPMATPEQSKKIKARFCVQNVNCPFANKNSMKRKALPMAMERKQLSAQLFYLPGERLRRELCLQ